VSVGYNLFDIDFEDGDYGFDGGVRGLYFNAVVRF
jgi:hypothetical protein